MLLSSLFILMSAILVPTDYLWLYSTHIILMCLYLMITKRLIVLFLIFLSVISVIGHELQDDFSLPLTVGQLLFFDIKTKTLFMQQSEDDAISLKKKPLVRLVSVLPNDVQQVFDNVPLSVSPILPNSVIKGKVTRIVLPNKKGAWWERDLYIKRQDAQLNVHFVDVNIPRLESSDVALRGYLINQLDSAFQSFPSWRFSKALLLGLDDLWSERDTWVVRTLGLAHLFVVSGLHVGFMFVIGRLISRLVWKNSPSKLLLSGVTCWHLDALIIIPLLLAYAYLTDWGEPVVRASIMLSVYLCIRMQALKVSSYSIITFSLWVVLLIEPRSILSPGLWLSYSMVYLLVGFSQVSTKLSRLLILQLMLSTASMVLILGWQEAIASGSILVNVLLVPLAGFVWFPWGIVSSIEVLIFGSTYSYSLLDSLLVYLELLLEWVAFTSPLFYFEEFTSVLPRIIMLFLICYWVYQSPLKRGLVHVLVIWLVLFFPMLFEIQKADFQLLNKENTLVLKNKTSILVSDAWSGDDISKLLFGEYLASSFKGEYLLSKGEYLLSPNTTLYLSPQVLLKYHIDWVILKTKSSVKTHEMLDALQVNWLIIPSGESLSFYLQNNKITLRHSACIYSFFLFKSDTCKRVEKLESVLNYVQT